MMRETKTEVNPSRISSETMDGRKYSGAICDLKGNSVDFEP